MLQDNKPHSTIDICREVYGDEHLGLARIGGLTKFMKCVIMILISLVNNERVSTHKADTRFLLNKYERNLEKYR